MSRVLLRVKTNSEWTTNSVSHPSKFVAAVAVRPPSTEIGGYGPSNVIAADIISENVYDMDNFIIW
jgi:hypothetical protein